MEVTEKDLLLLIEQVNRMLHDPFRNKIVLPGGCKPFLKYESYPESTTSIAHVITLTYPPNESPLYVVIKQIEYDIKWTPRGNYSYYLLYTTLLKIVAYAKSPRSITDMIHGTYKYGINRPDKPNDPNLYEYFGIEIPKKYQDGYDVLHKDLTGVPKDELIKEMDIPFHKTDNKKILEAFDFLARAVSSRQGMNRKYLRDHPDMNMDIYLGYQNCINTYEEILDMIWNEMDKYRPKDE